jgi:16S rRNA (uracil1498-N3)-methyltransferase
MNSIVLLPDELKNENEFEIVGSRFLELQKRHQLNCGNTLKAGIYNGNRGSIKILDSSNSGCSGNYVFNQDSFSRLPITVLLGISRPPTVKKVIHAVTTLGIEELILFRSEYSEKSYFDSKILSEDSILREVLLSLEQACDTKPPKISVVKLNLQNLFQNSLEKNISESACYFGHTQDSENSDISSSIRNGCLKKSVCLGIGSEKGWSQNEIELLTRYGFDKISFGSRMLRVEVALNVLIGVIATIQKK